MTEFYRGWRRKTGVLTLVMALVFVGGWMRSLFIYDNVRFSSSNSTLITVSFREGTIVWTVGTYHAGNFQSGWRLPDWESCPLSGSEPLDVTYRQVEWQWQWCGCCHGAYFWGEGFKNEVWIIPYGFAIFPLTMISAFLLLSKGRKTKQEKILGNHGNRGLES